MWSARSPRPWSTFSPAINTLVSSLAAFPTRSGSITSNRRGSNARSAKRRCSIRSLSTSPCTTGVPFPPCHGGNGNKRPGGKWRGLREKELSRRSGTPRLQCPPSRRQAMARHRRQGRLQGETREQPPVLWHTAQPSLHPLPLHPFEIATVSQVRASRQFRITLETNRSSSRPPPPATP